eukprot:CAMPEP_0113913374 /NCGR_PEP_ID=MMETSP0780_2-20120614/29525_1 /TAXON_ID=652834 /ORGANISM="Palpitomonas bilix" /LENGTH=473 /DNA_ID=CAMNT_0000910593 /DNA_START=287 /DNA_END=1709 /DNA_ORIENTATION=+ /assembly_acc=CAM_ASM_000599
MAAKSRTLLVFELFVGYICFYLTRRGFSNSASFVQRDLNLTTADIGLVNSLFSFAYGVSKIFTGAIVDQVNPSKLFPAALFTTAILNVLMCMPVLPVSARLGLSPSLWFCLIWPLNGLMQGFGWPPVGRIVKALYKKEERGAAWSAVSTSQNFGSALSPIISSIACAAIGWYGGMLAGGVAGVFLSFLLALSMCSMEMKEEGVHADGSKGKGKSEDVKERGNNKKEKTFFSSLADDVLLNYRIWAIGLCCLGVNFIRAVVSDWLPLYLQRERGFTPNTAASILSWFELGGFVGGLMAGVISDKVMKGRRAPVCFFFSLFAGFAAIACAYVPSPYLVGPALMVLGVFVFGPQVILGMFAMEISNPIAQSTTSGFMGMLGQAGAMLAGYPVGALLHIRGGQVMVEDEVSASLPPFIDFEPFSTAHAYLTLHPWTAILVIVWGVAVIGSFCLLPVWSLHEGHPSLIQVEEKKEKKE